MSKKIISIILSLVMLISSVGTVSFASQNATVEVTTTVTPIDGCYTRKGSSQTEAEIIRGNSMYVLDSNNQNNFRVAFLKFDMSDISSDELENASSIKLVLNDLQGDALPSNNLCDFRVSVLEESKNIWTGDTLNYVIAEPLGLFSDGTDVAQAQATMADTGEDLEVTLDKSSLLSVIESSTSKVITLRLQSTSGVWVFSGGISGETSPKLNITSEISIADEMQRVYDNLDFSDISSDVETNVTNDLDFSSTENLPYGIVAEWSSSSDGIVTNEGAVTQPITNYGGIDEDVTLTVTISCPEHPQLTPLVKEFYITVPARELTAQEIEDAAKVDVTTSVALTDGCFTRKGGGNTGDGIVPQGNGMYVLDSGTTNNFRVAFLKFDMSGVSIGEIENSDDISLILADLQGDALPSNSAYNIKVVALEESKNNWDSSTLSYSVANANSMYSGGTVLAEVSGSLGDTGETLEISLDKDTLYDVLDNSTSKVITLKVQSTSGVWVFSGGISGARSPKLSIVSRVSVPAVMQSIYDNLDFSDISSDIETNVTNDLDFSSTENLPYGIVAEWSTTSDGVVSLDGTVTRPITNFGGADADVTLTVTISCPDFPELTPLVKEFNLTVPARSLTDAEFVADEKLALTFDKIKGSNTSADEVISDLDYSYQGIYDDTTITYSASTPSGCVALDGTVTRPSFTSDDTAVTITATITHGQVSDTVVFNLTVKREEITEDFIITKELYPTHKAIISRNSPDSAETRFEPVVAASGNIRFSLLRFDLGELNDEELAGVDSALLRLYTTSEVPLNNCNYTVSIVNDELEQYLEATKDTTTYNMCRDNGLLEPSATTLIYDSGNILQDNQTYETTGLLDPIQANLQGSSNKIIWLKLNSNNGVIVFGSIKDENTLRRPALKVRHLMTAAEREFKAINVPSVLTENITLPTVGINGTPITWTTTDSSVVTSDGTITRYNIGENYALEDTVATLTATTSNAWDTFTKTYDVRVKMGGVIDASEDASFLSSGAPDVDSGELAIAHSSDCVSALLFHLTDADKADIAYGRKTALKLYVDPSYAGKDVVLYAIKENRLSEINNLHSLNFVYFDAILPTDTTKIETVTVGEDGYITFDVSDYVRYLSGSKAGFVLASRTKDDVRFSSLENANVIKIPKLIVSDQVYTDEYAAQKVAESIKFSDLTNDPQNELRFDLNLPTSGAYNSLISWSVTPPESGAINTTTGALNRTDSDQSVTLTATVTVGTEIATKSFNVVVKKAETTQEYLNRILEDINITKKHLTSSITLPGQELIDLGFVDAVEWVSSEDYEAQVNGFRLRLNRPASADLAVNLTVKVRFNGEEAQKDIGVWVLRSPDSNILRNRQVIRGDAGASQAVDENIDTVWQATRKTVVYNLNAKRVISSLTIIPYQTAIEGIKISISDDDVTYTEVYNGGRLEAEQLGYITFTPVAYGRYLKIELPQNSQGIRFLGAYTTSDESSGDVFSGVTVPNSTTSSFSLISTILGSSVTWTSSSSVITISGSFATVNRQKKDVNVTLTAKIVIDGETKTKNFVVKVPGTGETSDGGGNSSKPSFGGSTTITAPVGGSTTPVTPPAQDTPNVPAFSDLDKAPWAKEYITSLASKGIINGYGDGTFAPNSSITREEMSKLLVVAFGVTKGDNVKEFTDVDSSAWYYDYVTALVSKGYTNGIGNGLFGTGTNITRQDAFTMLASVLGISYDAPELDTGFNDDDKISPYARLAILALKEHGIIGGDTLGNINPTAGITRAEVAKIICHSLNK